MPDFRSGERTFQVLTQVAGRAGRGDVPGEVIVQTFRPQHYALRHAIAQDYDGFAREELQYRRELDYPPYSRMLRFRIEAQDSGPAEHFSTQLAMKIRKRLKSMGGVGCNDSTLEILGPTPGIFDKLQGRHRWQVVIKGSSSQRLNHLVQEITQTEYSGFRPPSGVKLGIDVDPIELY
jgi:primosomal protein N' (replication factor Y)